ncbi:serine hydrolase [Glaciibacter psychrotolerans]|uniref:CubicO group peptidase (Beta-lactamase class C family) n=1 Tax=Glaciibacter psychrotolerans TaxID=670054 RepID=A0A7Z0EGS1_9MICO|nr:CubicO group peptidase (beta-lactamase class C family) [Leifsonia psychrotolerans]
MDITGLNEFLADNDFSGVVLVRKGDETVFEAAMGLASQTTGAPNTPDTRFDIASITKLFTSVAVLQQIEAKQLDLETSIHYYADLAGTTIGTDVTLLHLLTHTSGIADLVDEEAGESYAELWAKTPLSSMRETADFLPLFAHKEPLAGPGVESNYSDAGYILAGLALERAAGQSYRAYIDNEIFAHAGLDDTDFFDRADATPRLAEGWDQADDGSWISNADSALPIGAPHEGAQSTASDLIKFLDALRAGALLSAELTEEFFSPQVDLDDGTRYGFGLEFDLDIDGSVRSYYADGVAPGASGILRHYYGAGLDVVVLSNSEEGAWDVIRELDERLDG